EPDGPPLIPGSAGLADYLTGVYAAFGAVTALRHRDRTGEGQEVDIALYEAVFQMLGDLVETYDHLGEVQDRIGSMNPHAAPHNNFRAKDGKWVAIGCTSNGLFAKLVKTMGQPDLLEDERFSSNRSRIAHRQEIESTVASWAKEHPADELVATLIDHGVPASLIYTVSDAFSDSHYWERGAIVRIPTDDVGDLATRGVVPRLTATPGRIDHLGGRIGADNDSVYTEVLGLKPDEIAKFRRHGVI
ncbi:MAG TPA: CoA transferase, partial [Acidimicrobiales bacterium]